MKIARVSPEGPPVTLRKLKEVSFKLAKRVEYVTSICMGRAVGQFEKENSCRLGIGVEYIMLHRTVLDAPSASTFEKEVSFILETGV